MRGPTDRPRAVLGHIADSIRERGYPPTLREIGKLMAIKSTNGVNDHLRALERMGLIVRSACKSRALRLTGAGHEVLGGGPVTPVSDLERSVVQAAIAWHVASESEPFDDVDFEQTIVALGGAVASMLAARTARAA